MLVKAQFDLGMEFFLCNISQDGDSLIKGIIRQERRMEQLGFAGKTVF